MLQGDYVEKCYVKLLTVTSIKAVKCILLYFLILPRNSITIQSTYVYLRLIYINNDVLFLYGGKIKRFGTLKSMKLNYRIIRTGP